MQPARRVHLVENTHHSGFRIPDYSGAQSLADNNVQTRAVAGSLFRRRPEQNLKSTGNHCHWRPAASKNR